MKEKIKNFIEKKPKATTEDLLAHLYHDIMIQKAQGRSWSSIIDEISFSGVYISESSFYKHVVNKNKT
ncbi:hypothetical protein ACNARK_17460 [Proteus sp. DFP240708]|jgi:hypothetical protein|uniref:Phage protein n=1 Tax=Proteus genomosp. 6 TaxID=1311820 RepID=A0ABV1LEI4_9GAMM|nr:MULTISPECIES: hypothetical protein [Morganellaceae]MBG2712525.1 hypothetical protein [Proteus mirabilis]MDF4667372.1 hypothetical protein [Vibrio parahaemolyticus]ELR5259461.1 hypothetical protein [Providencia rettgeri]MBG2769258.1 hypothetical protein [Proteus mirabilis]MDF4696734.1 hypothetical protein [Vibrio parahaemolyticus]